MLTQFPVCVAVGTLLGILASLGVGGGSLLILWLTLVLGAEQETARSINLMFFLPAAVIGCCFRWNQGVLQPGKIFPAIASGCTAAAAAIWLSQGWDMEIMKKLFGVLLLATGIRELLWKERAPA